MTRPQPSERELEAKELGHCADIAFSIACRKLGLPIEESRAAPLHSVIMAEAEKAAV